MVFPFMRILQPPPLLQKWIFSQILPYNNAKMVKSKTRLLRDLNTYLKVYMHWSFKYKYPVTGCKYVALWGRFKEMSFYWPSKLPGVGFSGGGGWRTKYVTSDLTTSFAQLLQKQRHRKQEHTCKVFGRASSHFSIEAPRERAISFATTLSPQGDTLNGSKQQNQLSDLVKCSPVHH